MFLNSGAPKIQKHFSRTPSVKLETGVRIGTGSGWLGVIGTCILYTYPLEEYKARILKAGLHDAISLSQVSASANQKTTSIEIAIEVVF